MKNSLTILTLGVVLMASTSIQAQTQNPDQNPNYQQSRDKYMTQTDEYSQKQGTTEQDTYKAYDWTEHKEEVKQDRIDRRQDRRLAKYQSRRYYYHPHPYYNNGYYNNGYNYNGYNGYYNYNANPYYYPSYNYGGYNNYNSYPVLNSLLLGYTLYSIFN